MPAILTWGGVAFAVLGLLIAFAGLPDRAAGLGLGSDLIQVGASILVGGLVIAALGQMLKALYQVADRIEDASFGLSAPGHSLNDELAEETPVPLPRASARGAGTAREAVPAESAPVPPVRETRAPRTVREPQPAPAAPAATAMRTQRPAPEAQRPSRQEPGFEQPQEEDFADAYSSQRRESPPEPRWMRAQAEASRQQPAGGVIPLQSTRPTRATPVAPASPPRRDAAVAPAPAARAPAYEADPRRRPAAAAEEEPADQSEPSVVRSGIIGGMAYTLYSDGSIEADLPAGLVRFNSLSELQEHVRRAGVEDKDGDYRGPNAAQH